jgi:threonine synthase
MEKDDMIIDELSTQKDSPASSFKKEPLKNSLDSGPNSPFLAQGPGSLSLLDDASPQAPIIAPELETQKAVAADPGQPLEDRLEAYEDIMESEVGDTTLTRSRNVEREVGLRQIYLKFEGGNPTGTQKDRIAFAQVRDALRRGFDAITVATCGNYGAAMAIASSMAGLQCIIYIPEGYHTKRIEEMERSGAQFIRVPGDYENAVQLSRERAITDDIYDANPGGANTALQLKGYGEIAYEIYDELRDAPAFVAVPVSNGTTLAGIYKGFVSLYRRGKTSRIPRMVAGSSHGKNPIIRAFMKNMPHCEDLEPSMIRETLVNYPLINWHAIDGDHALESIRKSGGWASYASDSSMLSYARLLRDKEGLSVLPASTAGLITLIEKHRKQSLPGDRYVAILTGRKS